MRFDLRDDAALAADMVIAAGSLAQQMRKRGVEAQQKQSISDVVTAADRAAEALMVDHLAVWRSEDGVVGEEGSSVEGTSGRRWIIDPVDGTYNFVQGLTWWCSAVALMDGDELLLGAIYHPHDKLLYVGGPTLSSTRNGELLYPITDAPLSEICAATYLPPSNAETGLGKAFRRVAKGAAALRMLGSGSLDAVAIAQGHLGVYFQHSVPDWDWFPGLAILQGAGGVGRKVETAKHVWSVMGAPTAVDDVCARLTKN